MRPDDQRQRPRLLPLGDFQPLLERVSANDIFLVWGVALGL